MPDSASRRLLPRDLDDDDADRTICRDCMGAGRDCPACGHTGRVCPHCRGIRFLRREWTTAKPISSVQEEDRCPVCCEGNQVNPLKEAQAIGRYLNWRHVIEQRQQAQ